MQFDEYQKKTRETVIYPDKDNNFIFPVIGLAGETGEVSEKIKKVIRDKNGIVDDISRDEIKKELGDVLWYLAQLATELQISLNDVAQENISKTIKRKADGVIHGNGDNR